MKDLIDPAKLKPNSYNKNEWPYFFHDIFLAPYWQNNDWKKFMVIGTKNTGKTTSFLIWAIKRAIAGRFKAENRFVLVVRTVKLLQDYWSGDMMGGVWWNDCSMEKGIVSWMDSEGEKWPICRLESLSGTGKGMGKENHGYDLMIIDDFVGLPGAVPIKGCAKSLVIMISNYARDNIDKFKVVMTGNNNRLDAELLKEFDVQIPPGGGVFEYPEANMIVYAEGPKTKQGIINVEKKQFDKTCLAGFNQQTLSYLYSNFCLTSGEMIIY